MEASVLETNPLIDELNRRGALHAFKKNVILSSLEGVNNGRAFPNATYTLALAKGLVSEHSSLT